MSQVYTMEDLVRRYGPDSEEVESVSSQSVLGTAGGFASAVAASHDIGDAGVAARHAGLVSALAAWQAGGAVLADAGAVLEAGNALLDALYDVNPEKLPLAYRTQAEEFDSVILASREQGLGGHGVPPTR